MSESTAVRPADAPAASGSRGAGALTRWETVRAVMRLELLIAWRRRDTAALLGLYALGALGAVVPGLRGWLGIFSPEKLVYYLLAAVLMVGLMLWRPSREARMRQLYGALPVTRLDVLAARYLLLAVGWAIMLLGETAVVLAMGGLSNDTVGRHLTYLFLIGLIAAVGRNHLPARAHHVGPGCLPPCCRARGHRGADRTGGHAPAGGAGRRARAHRRALRSGAGRLLVGLPLHLPQAGSLREPPESVRGGGRQ